MPCEEVVDHVVDWQTSNLHVFEASMRVVILYKISVADCDRWRIKTTLNSRAIAARNLNNLSISGPSEAHASANDVVLYSGEKRRRVTYAHRHVVVDNQHNGGNDK